MPKDEKGHGSNPKALHERVGWLPPGSQAAVHVGMSDPITIAKRLNPKIQEHRTALMQSDAAGLAGHALQHGLSDADMKYLIDDNYSSPAMRAKIYQGYLKAKI